MPLLYYIVDTPKKTSQEIAGKIDSLRITGKSYAAFDMDNTLLVGDIAEAVFALLVKKKIIKNFRWRDYATLLEKNRLQAYETITDIMQGLKLSVLKEATTEVINSKQASIIVEDYKIPVPKPDQKMKLILKMLRKKGIAIYVVTASNEVSARIICKKYFKIPSSHIMGAQVACDKKGIIKARSKAIPYAKEKVNILKRRFRNKPIATGGDSPGDKYLLRYTAKRGIRFWLGKQSYSDV